MTDFLNNVPAVGNQFKDQAALESLLAKAKGTLKALNSVTPIGPTGPTSTGSTVPTPPVPNVPPAAKPGETPTEEPKKTADDANGPYFKDHPDWLNEAVTLLTKADRALASVLIEESASGQAFKLNAEKRVQELKNWVQHEGRYTNDPYFLDTFLAKKVGKKVAKLSDEDMKLLEPKIRDIVRSTDTNTPAAGSGAAAATRQVTSARPSGPSPGPRRRASSRPRASARSWTLADDVVELVESPGFGGSSRVAGPAPVHFLRSR